MADIFLSTGYIAEEHSQAIQSEGEVFIRNSPRPKLPRKAILTRNIQGYGE